MLLWKTVTYIGECFKNWKLWKISYEFYSHLINLLNLIKLRCENLVTLYQDISGNGLNLINFICLYIVQCCFEWFKGIVSFASFGSSIVKQTEISEEKFYSELMLYFLCSSEILHVLKFLEIMKWNAEFRHPAHTKMQLCVMTPCIQNLAGFLCHRFDVTYKEVQTSKHTRSPRQGVLDQWPLGTSV